MSFDRTETAVVFIDPQVDVLSKNGKNWGAVGASVTENKTVENMLRIFKAAKSAKFRKVCRSRFRSVIFHTHRSLNGDDIPCAEIARYGHLSEGVPVKHMAAPARS